MDINIKPPTDRPEVSARGSSQLSQSQWEFTRYADGSVYLKIDNEAATLSVADAEELIRALSTTLRENN